MNTTPQRVLIVGLGITGMATAIRLHRLGWQPVIIEKAAGRRAGGYTMWLFGSGRASASRLGILDDIVNRVHPDYHTYEINRADDRRDGFSFTDLPDEPRMVLRGDVEQALFEGLPEAVEIRYSTVPTAIEQDASGATVTLKQLETGITTHERFDLVVGADGVRSTVRKLVFGSDETFLRPLGYMIATCILSKPLATYGVDEGFVLAEARRSAWLFSYANHNPTVLFSYRTDDVNAEFSRSPIEALRKVYGTTPTGPILSQLLDEYEQADQKLFDSVNQVKMERWSKGRVVLVGDAAWCLTLYSGMGASTGMSGGELLGDMLEAHPDNLTLALNNWEAQMRPFIDALQQDAMTLRVIFTPQSEIQRIFRSALLKFARSPLLTPLTKQLAKGMDLKSHDIVKRRLPA